MTELLLRAISLALVFTYLLLTPAETPLQFAWAVLFSSALWLGLYIPWQLANFGQQHFFNWIRGTSYEHKPNK